jgi:hypothetical protein
MATKKYKSRAELALTLIVDRDVMTHDDVLPVEVGVIVGHGRISLTEQYEHVKGVSMDAPADESTINFRETDGGTYILAHNEQDIIEFETLDELVEEVSERMKLQVFYKVRDMLRFE